MALIEAKDVEKIFEEDGVRTPAVQGVSFDITDGEFVAIMGPSGSGKSTLLHILGFLDRPTSGTFRFEGKAIHELTDDELAYIRSRKMGFVFQAFNLLARTTVLENVKLPLVYGGVKRGEQDEIAKAAINAVGLTPRLEHESSQLSGGERQRVAIARAIVNKPRVIYADEPTGNLDSKSGLQIMEILQKFNGEGSTIVLITHETYIAEHAKRIIHIVDGRVDSDSGVKKRRMARF